jgi:hypothetical protein
MAVVIVSGLSRSGTSMMMQMLQAGGVPLIADDVRKPDEHNPKGYFEDERIRRLRQDAAWMAEADGKAIKVIHSLLYDLPHGFTYKVIFMTRPMPEVLLSQRSMLATLGTLESRLPDEALGVVFCAKGRPQADPAGRHWLRESLRHSSAQELVRPTLQSSGGALARRPASTLSWAGPRSSYSLTWSARSSRDRVSPGARSESMVGAG